MEEPDKIADSTEDISIEKIEEIKLHQESTETKEEKPIESIPEEIETAVPEAALTAADGKSVGIMIAVLVGIFVLFLGGSHLYNSLTAGAVVTVDDLHSKNLQGDLKEGEGYVYNGYSFVKADGLWWTEFNKFGTLLKIPLHFGPRDLEDIKISGTIDPTFNDGEIVYVAIDPKTADQYYLLGVSELSFNIITGMDRKPEGSCIEENWACENRTIISCDNTQGKPVIELVYEETDPKIELEGTCIKLTGYEYGLTKAVDRLLYQWYGAMT